MKKQVIITLTGPTCSGKSTLAKFLTKRYGIKEIRSFTTRPMRDGEKAGREYDFITKAEYARLQRDGLVVQDVALNGNFYGSSVANVTEAFDEHGICSIVVEPTGVPQFQRAANLEGWRVLPIFIGQPTERLVARYMQRVREDKKTPLDFHARRMLNLIQDEVRAWRSMVEYTMEFDAMDDSDPVESQPQTIAEMIVEQARALRHPVRGRLAA
jgi:guanylate kinase